MNELLIWILAGVLLAVLGAAAAFWTQWRRALRAAAAAASERDQAHMRLQSEEGRRDELAQRLRESQTAHAAAAADLGAQKEKNAELAARLEGAQEMAEELRQTRQTLTEREKRVSELQEKLANESRKEDERRELEARAEARFKNLAQEILDDKSRKFTEENRKQLEPLEKNLAHFRARMEQMQTDSAKQRAELQTSIGDLHKGAMQISEDTNNLARALKGSGKMQGQWGEALLKRLLEESGLRRGAHYEEQAAHRDEDGKRFIPDFVIKMPDGRHLVLDSKISLSAYVDYSNAETDEARADALRRHVRAVKHHVVDLHQKNYSQLQGMNSPDFVLMFMGLEPAFILALQEDGMLFQNARDRNVILTGPTTLMPVLRMVENLWSIDKRTKESEEIVRQGGNIIAKVDLITSAMREASRALNKAQEMQDVAIKRVTDGKGSLVSIAAKLSELGVSGKRQRQLTDLSDSSQ